MHAAPLAGLGTRPCCYKETWPLRGRQRNVRSTFKLIGNAGSLVINQNQIHQGISGGQYRGQYTGG